MSLLSRRKNMSNINIPRNGLVGEWLFTSGSLLDTSGNSYHLVNQDCVPAPDRKGVPNNAYSFSGIGTAMSGNAHLIGTDDFSLSLWVYRRDTKVSGRIVDRGASSDLDPGYAVIELSSTQLRILLSNGVDPRLFLDVNLGLNAWHNLTINSDRAGNMDAYVNNVYGGSVDISSFVGDNISNVVNGFGAFGLIYSDMVLDDVRYYNRVLSTEEITKLYNE